jgi:hypothetical protein
MVRPIDAASIHNRVEAAYDFFVRHDDGHLNIEETTPSLEMRDAALALEEPSRPRDLLRRRHTEMLAAGGGDR